MSLGDKINAIGSKAANLVRLVFCLALLAVSGGLPGALAQDPPPPADQQGTDEGASGFRLEQNYPNPFNPETRIPFHLSEDLFQDGEPATVSVRIYNILQQFVVAPRALRYPGGEGLPLLQLEYTSPGRYEAYWDGRDRTGNHVASGVYLVQMVVNGRAAWMKMFVTK